MAATSTSLELKVQRRDQELVAPAAPTPLEYKTLSDIDDQESLRYQVPFIQFYPREPSMKGKDPVKVIREALAKALVFYYPFAGRLREGPNRKLLVDCTAEGVLLVEADANVTLAEFGDALHPPFPCLEELLCDVPGSGGVLSCPLLLIQVTRLKCGGFIFALSVNHTVSDAAGIVQFMAAMGEIARGAEAPSILPVWERHRLNARDPPRITCMHHEYDEVADTKGTIIPRDDMADRSFFFGPTEMSAIRRFVPPHLHRCPRFEVLTAFLWRCRTIALQPDANEEMRIICVVNSRTKFNPRLPTGFYGNALAYPAAMTTAEELCQNPFGYALELVRKAKAAVTEEYLRSTADFMVTKGRPPLTEVRSFLVSDLTRAGFQNVDFGWGKAAYGGPAKCEMGPTPGFGSLYLPVRSKKGEDGIVVPVCLPAPAMERFVKELDKVLKEENISGGERKPRFIPSAL